MPSTPTKTNIAMAERKINILRRKNVLSKKLTRHSVVDIPLMIEEIQKRPCLWDPNSPGYGDRRATLEKWCEIGELLDWDVDTLKTKWKNLRDTHRRIVKLEMSEPLYKSNWLHLKEMEFLVGALDLSVDVDEEENDDEVPLNKIKIKREEQTDDIELELEPTDFVDTITSEHDMLGHHSEEYNENDYDLMYLKSLLPFFKTLDPYRKLVVRNKIQEVLLMEMAEAQDNRSIKK